MNTVAGASGSVAGFPDGARGVTPPINPQGAGGFLSDVIVQLGIAETNTVERAVQVARERGKRADQILLEDGVLNENDLARALAERYGIDHVDLQQFEIDTGAATLIPKDTAVRYRALPIAFAMDGALIVAVADPVDALAISDIEVMTKSETRKAVASGTMIVQLAENLPDAPDATSAGNRGAGAMQPPPPANSAPPAAGAQPPAAPPIPQAPPAPAPAASAAALALEAQLSQLQPMTQPPAYPGQPGMLGGQQGVGYGGMGLDSSQAGVIEQVIRERDALRAELAITRERMSVLERHVVELNAANSRAHAAAAPGPDPGAAPPAQAPPQATAPPAPPPQATPPPQPSQPAPQQPVTPPPTTLPTREPAPSAEQPPPAEPLPPGQ